MCNVLDLQRLDILLFYSLTDILSETLIQRFSQFSSILLITK
jgi:hypothetical protein